MIMNNKINKLRIFLLDLPRDIKLIISLAVDSFLCILTVWLAFYLRLGLFISLEPGYEAQIRPRSGLALNKGITVINSPGTIDADYRGEIGVILINLSDSSFEINSGDRIAQMIIAKHETISWRVVENLDQSDRGNKGFGSTGV